MRWRASANAFDTSLGWRQPSLEGLADFDRRRTGGTGGHVGSIGYLQVLPHQSPVIQASFELTRRQGDD